MISKIILPLGYSAEIQKGKDFKIFSSKGYFKLIGFPHKFWDAIYEYGDNQGHKWNADGEPLTENTEKDVDFNKLTEIVGFSSVKEKLVVRQRVLDEYNRLFEKNIK